MDWGQRGAGFHGKATYGRIDKLGRIYETFVCRGWPGMIYKSVEYIVSSLSLFVAFMRQGATVKM